MKQVSSGLYRALGIALALLLCMALLPATALAAEDAAAALRVASTEGTVTVKSGSGLTVSMSDNMLLRNGWTVETAAASYATLSLDGAPAIKLGAGTVIELRQSPGSNMTELFISKGSVFFDVGEALAAGERLILHTPTAVSDVSGTMGEMKVIDPQCTQMYLLEGCTSVINIAECFFAPEDTDAAEAGEAPAATGGEAAPTAVSSLLTGSTADPETVSPAAGLTSVLTGTGPSGGASPAPAINLNTILTVRSGDGRTTVFVENTRREVVVNGVTVPSGGKANAPAAGAAPAVTPMTPADRAELGASLAARSGAATPAAGPNIAPTAPAGMQEIPFAYTNLARLRTGDIGGIALEHLSRQTESALRAIEAIRASGGDAEVVGFIENLTPEVAAEVKTREEQAAAKAAAESEGANEAWKTEAEAKAARNGANSNVTNTWDPSTTEPMSQAIAEAQSLGKATAVLNEPCKHGKVTTNKSESGVGKAIPGETITVTATPDEGYVLAAVYYWFAGDTIASRITVRPNNGVYSFAMPDWGIKVYATFVPVEEVSVTLDETVRHGTVTADKTGRVLSGETVTVTVTPDEHYLVDSVYYKYTYNLYDRNFELDVRIPDTAVITPVDGVYRFTVPNSPTVTVGANFKEKPTCPVVIRGTEHGTLTADKSGQSVYVDDTVTLTVTPDAGYVIDKVCYYYNGGTFDILPVNGVYSFVVPNVPALTVYAFFKEGTEYDILLPTVSHGEVSAASYGGSGVTKAAPGDYVTVTFRGAVEDGLHYSAGGVTAGYGEDSTPVTFLTKFRSGDTETGAVTDVFTFEMPEGGVTFTGEFAPCYPVTVAEEGVKVSKVGGLSMSAGRDPYAAAGEIVVLTAAEGGSLPPSLRTGHYENGIFTAYPAANQPAAIDDATCSFLMPAGAVTVTTEAAQTVTLTLDESFAGTEGLTVTANDAAVTPAVAASGTTYTVPKGAPVKVTYTTAADAPAGLFVTAGETATRAARELVRDEDAYRLGEDTYLVVSTYTADALGSDVSLGSKTLRTISVRDDSYAAVTAIGDYGGQSAAYLLADEGQGVSYTVYVAEEGDEVKVVCQGELSGPIYGPVALSPGGQSVPVTGRTLARQMSGGSEVYLSGGTFKMPAKDLIIEGASMYKIAGIGALSEDTVLACDAVKLSYSEQGNAITEWYAVFDETVTLTLTAPADTGCSGVFVTEAGKTYSIPPTARSLTVEGNTGVYQTSFTMPDGNVTATVAGLHRLIVSDGVSSNALSFDPGEGARLFAAAGETVTLTVDDPNSMPLAKWGTQENAEVLQINSDSPGVYRFIMPEGSGAADYPVVVVDIQLMILQ